MKPQTDEFDIWARDLAKELTENLEGQYTDTRLINDANFDYAYGETPVIDVYSSDYIRCDEISEQRFDVIDAAIEAIAPIKGNGFEAIVMLSDNSGYDYWSTQGDALMVMVTVELTDIEAIDGNELLDAFVTLGNTIHDIIEGDLT